MYTALTLRSACSHSSYKLPMPGGEGPSPRLSLGGFKGGILFGKRIPPLAVSYTHLDVYKRQLEFGVSDLVAELLAHADVVLDFLQAAGAL